MENKEVNKFIDKVKSVFNKRAEEWAEKQLRKQRDALNRETQRMWEESFLYNKTEIRIPYEEQ